LDSKEQAFDEIMEKLAVLKPANRLPYTPALPVIPNAHKPLASIQKREVAMWQEAKKSNWDPQFTKPLLRSMEPLIQKRSSLYKNRGVEIPHKAVDFEHRRLALEAIKTYDPNRGTKLGTWVTGRLKNASKFIGQNQNTARIVDAISAKIGDYQRFKSELSDQLGREPTAQEIHDNLMKIDHDFERLRGTSLREIHRLDKEQRKDLFSTGSEINMSGAARTLDYNKELMHTIMDELTPEEKKVHVLTMGLEGNPRLPPGQIARRLHMDNSKVSKIRTSILKKMEPYRVDLL